MTATTVSEPESCPSCEGKGVNFSPSYFDGYATCLLCGGSGRVIFVRELEQGQRQYRRVEKVEP